MEDIRRYKKGSKSTVFRCCSTQFLHEVYIPLLSRGPSLLEISYSSGEITEIFREITEITREIIEITREITEITTITSEVMRNARAIILENHT